MTKINPSATPDAVTAVNGATGVKHTITIAFGPRDEELYKALVEMAETDERPLPQFVLRLIRESVKVEPDLK